MAKNKTSRLTDHKAAFDTLLKRTDGAREVVSDRKKIHLATLGDYFIGHLDGLREGTQKGEKFRIYDFTFPGGEYPGAHAAFLLGAGNLDQKLTGSLVGHVVGVMFEAEKDIGQKSPMKVYRVIDFGEDYPGGINETNCISIAAVRDADSSDNGVPGEDNDLPF